MNPGILINAQSKLTSKAEAVTFMRIGHWTCKLGAGWIVGQVLKPLSMSSSRDSKILLEKTEMSQNRSFWLTSVSV